MISESKALYNKLKLQYEDTEDYYSYTSRGKAAFAFWDGVSYYPSNFREHGHKMLTVVCPSCMEDTNTQVVEKAVSLGFHSTIYRLEKSIFPCGCSKVRGKTLLQHHGIDDFIGEQRDSALGGVVTVKECLGGKGNKRKYILECDLCALDEELWPYGSLTTTKSNFQNKDRPVNCGCNPSKVLCSEEQIAIKVKRLCQEKGLEFKGWTGGKYTTTNKTALLLYCPKHGMSDNTRVDKFLIREGGCKPCAQESSSYGLYKGREQEEDNLYLLKVVGCGESFYKMGRTFNLKNRIYQHGQHSPYSFTLVSAIQKPHEVISALEVQLLDLTYNLWYKPVYGWAGGYNECRLNSFVNHPEIINTFNLNKGEQNEQN